VKNCTVTGLISAGGATIQVRLLFGVVADSFYNIAVVFGP
jgi:hypothetical protein